MGICQNHTHAQLVESAAKWLKRNGFSVIGTEIIASGSREIPDAIGFREAGTCTALVEVKVSRSDFLADAKKPWRAPGAAGLGLYRFYLSPPDVISIEDLPAGWGLLHASGRRILDVHRPLGNSWPVSEEHAMSAGGWLEFQHKADRAAELAILFSIARRLSV